MSHARLLLYNIIHDWLHVYTNYIHAFVLIWLVEYGSRSMCPFFNVNSLCRVRSRFSQERRSASAEPRSRFMMGMDTVSTEYRWIVSWGTALLVGAISLFLRSLTPSEFSMRSCCVQGILSNPFILSWSSCGCEGDKSSWESQRAEAGQVKEVFLLIWRFAGFQKFSRMICKVFWKSFKARRLAAVRPLCACYWRHVH